MLFPSLELYNTAHNDNMLLLTSLETLFINKENGEYQSKINFVVDDHRLVKQT